jgi:hypothetical protein
MSLGAARVAAAEGGVGARHVVRGAVDRMQVQRRQALAEARVLGDCLLAISRTVRARRRSPRPGPLRSAR